MLTLADMSVRGYRSLRCIRFPVDPLTVLVGGNGVGKTNLYRALQLAQAAASGDLARTLAAEGGMDSAYWAGERRAKDPVRIGIGVELRDGAGMALGYRVEAGIKTPTAAGFPLEPQVKEEELWQAGRRRVELMSRRGPGGFAVDREGARQELGTDLLPGETALGSVRDGGRFPDLDLARRTLLAWRFYHDFRTDPGSALRQPCLAVTAPTLAHDGADLAAVFATLAHIRQDTRDLDEAVEAAFPGARLLIPEPGRTASFGLVFPDHPRRVFEPAELSDGTLRYLALAGALLAYRLPPFLALNEPETSLHPGLLDPLARLIARAAERTQVWLVTHSAPLAEAVARHAAVLPRQVIKRDGATWIEGLRVTGEFGD